MLGVSLGGYLSLSLASKDRRITAVASLMAGMPPEIVAETTYMPPTLLLHGEADATVPISEALVVESLLKRLGTKHELKIYPDRDIASRVWRKWTLLREHCVF